MDGSSNADVVVAKLTSKRKTVRSNSGKKCGAV